MTTDSIVLLAVKSQVLAISKRDGRTLWTTRLSGGMTSDFVTLVTDGPHIYAHTKGQLHCLDLQDGRLLWSNELPGCGYGIASIAIPGGASAPAPGVAQVIANQQAAAAGGAA